MAIGICIPLYTFWKFYWLNTTAMEVFQMAYKYSALLLCAHPMAQDAIHPRIQALAVIKNYYLDSV